MSRLWPTMPNFGALSTSMRRSNSSGRPVRMACTGASKPRPAADFGMSCTWPSVIMTTPARRSGGTLASARLSSANRLVPEGPSPVGFEESTHLTSRFGILPSLASRSARMAAVCSGRPAMVWLVDSSTTTMAMLARLSRSSWRSVGLASAPIRQASESARSVAPRVRRNSSAATSSARHGDRGPEQGRRDHRRDVDRPVQGRAQRSMR